MKNLWQIEMKFGDGGVWRSRRLQAESLRLGAHPDASLRLPSLGADSLYEFSIEDKELAFKAKGSSKKADVISKTKNSLHFSVEGAEFKVSIIKEERNHNRFEPESWVANFKDFEANSYVLWHLNQGYLVDTQRVGVEGDKILLKCGYEVFWKPKENPDVLVLSEHNNDVHSLELEPGRGGALRAQFADELFILTRAPSKELIAKLEEPLVRPPSENRPHGFLAFIVSGAILMSLLQFLPDPGKDKNVVLESLSPEMTKIVIEQRKEKNGGNGTQGGGGIETEHYDRRGGGGLAALDNLVKDKAAPMGSKGVLSALSALDEGVKVGKFKTAGLMPSNIGQKMLGSAQGVLGALGKIQGVGAGGGVGIGGVGTKGLGGGGGGGQGKGFGTGVGDGLGKGDGTRNVIFESDNSVIRGGLDRAEVDAVVQENLSQIRFCYNRGLRSNPGLQGKVISLFTIGADGGVKTSRLRDSTLSAPEVEQCIQGRVALWKFPKPRGGGEVTVNYPFLLKSN